MTGISDAISVVADVVTPWFLGSQGLNGNEDVELARRRALGATIDVSTRASSSQQSTQKVNPMAGEGIISGAKRALELVKQNPKIASKVSEYYQKATGKVIDFTKSNAAEVVRRGPAPAAVLLRAAVGAGLNPDDIFESNILADQRDRVTSEIIVSLRQLYSSVATRLDSQSVLTSSGDLAGRLLNKEVILFAQQKFGSPAAIREAHAKLRLFLGMDTQLLEETIALHIGR